SNVFVEPVEDRFLKGGTGRAAPEQTSVFELNDDLVVGGVVAPAFRVESDAQAVLNVLEPAFPHFLFIRPVRIVLGEFYVKVAQDSTRRSVVPGTAGRCSRVDTKMLGAHIGVLG